jgi:membrane protease YdiL (CAAX protease family)
MEDGNAVMEQKSKLSAWATLLLFIAVFVGIYLAVHWLRDVLTPLFHPQTLHEKAVFQICGSVALDWLELLGMLAILRLSGRTLSDLGWRRPSTFGAWVFAACVVVIYAGYAAFGLLKGSAMLTDWSAFRVLSALSVGITAGFCEEALFRGFVISEAKNGGAPVWLQIVLSGLLFGLAHVGWGGMGGAHFDIGSAIGSAISTGVLGAVLAGVYIVGKRSLMPVVAAHAAIDMIIEPWLIMFALSGGFAHMGH